MKKFPLAILVAFSMTIGAALAQYRVGQRVEFRDDFVNYGGAG